MKFHISYQIIVWSLVMMALIMAGGFLTISYTYQVQDANSQIIEENIQNVRAAKELEIGYATLKRLLDNQPLSPAVINDINSVKELADVLY